MNYGCNVCGKANSVNRSGTGSCWNCCCLIVGGYRVSCVVTIVIKDQLDGINLFTEDRRVFTRETGLVSNPVTPCDVICVYTKMNENFKGGINNVMIKNNDLTDSRYHQRCADNGHRSLAHASVPLVRDADWSADYSVGPIPVGEIRINYLRDPAGRGQSPDAAPSTGLLPSVIIVLQHTVLSVTRWGILYVLKDFSYDGVLFKRAKLWMVRC